MKTLKWLVVVLFFLASFSTGCKKDESNPCDSVICQNGGNCIDGQCNCPIGYFGSHCESEITPLSAILTKIEVTQFPHTNNGSSWDEFSGAPDIYLELYYGTTSLIFTSVVIDDVSSPITLTYTTGLPVVIDPVTSVFGITLLDEDFIVPEFMGGYNFIPYTYGQGFPSVVEISGDANGITILLYLTWNH